MSITDIPLVNAVWDLTKKQYPEFESPETQDEGIVKIEEKENPEHCENSFRFLCDGSRDAEKWDNPY